MSEELCGFLNIKKPLGITAHDVVARVRKIVRLKQVGHGGTLDPLAEGVLPVAVGKATRLLRFIDGTKVYLAEIRLGLKTTTDDMEGDELSSSSKLPTEDAICKSIHNYVGDLQQIPPLYSAVHVDGKRLYELARAGQTVESMPLRPVSVYSIEELGYIPPIVKLRITCGAGTYIRSIARDLGDELECGGCLSSLIREQAGPFRISNSVSLEDLQLAADQSRLSELVSPPESALKLNRVDVDSAQALKLRLGQSLELSTAEVPASQEHVVALYENKLVAVCRWGSEAGSSSVRIQPEVVLADGQTSK